MEPHQFYPLRSWQQRRFQFDERRKYLIWTESAVELKIASCIAYRISLVENRIPNSVIHLGSTQLFTLFNNRSLHSCWKVRRLKWLQLRALVWRSSLNWPTEIPSVRTERTADRHGNRFICCHNSIMGHEVPDYHYTEQVLGTGGDKSQALAQISYSVVCLSLLCFPHRIMHFILFLVLLKVTWENGEISLLEWICKMRVQRKRGNQIYFCLTNTRSLCIFADNEWIL